MKESRILRSLVVSIFATSVVLCPISFAQTTDVLNKSLEKEKVEFGEAINQTNKEVKAAESNYKKIVKTKKYIPRKKSMGKHTIKVEPNRESIEAKDNVNWDHNRDEALKIKKKLDRIDTLGDFQKNKDK